MLKRYLKQRLPNIYEMRKKYHLGWLGDRLFDPRLWGFHRHNVALAVAVAAFVAMQPLLGLHVLIITALVFIWPMNLPVALISIWITNPLTQVPIAYGEYYLGMWILGRDVHHFKIEWSWQWFVEELGHIWEPLLLGSILLGILLAILCYGLVRLLWRIVIIYRWKKRHQNKPKL